MVILRHGYLVSWIQRAGYNINVEYATVLFNFINEYNLIIVETNNSL